MSTDEGTWAPKSPDLSSFFSSGGPDSTAAVAAPFTSAPNPNFASGSGPGSGYSPSTYNSHQPQAAHYGQPQPHQTYSSPATYNNYNSYTAASPNSSSRPQQPYSSPQQPQDHYAQVPQLGYAISQHTASHTGPQPYYSSYTEPPANQYPPAQAQPQQQQQPPPPQLHHQFVASFDQHQPDPSGLPSAMPPRKSATGQVAQQPEIMASPVRTKFPTARIKRIMQADEEVGKVAQQTPIAVGKALELFMVQIVSKSADVAKDKNSKRITAQMLKQAVEGNQQWDFLQDIVGKVSEKEDKESKSKAKANETTDSDEEPDAAPKKKGRGGRKKKADS